MSTIRPDTHQSGKTTVLGAPALSFAVGGALLLCWPMLVFDGPLIFFDTEGYLSQGRAIFERLGALVTRQSGVNLDVGELRKEAASAGSTRALAYAAFVFLTSWPFGLTGTAVLQTTFVLLMVWPLVQIPLANKPSLSLMAGVGTGIAAMALLTSLPFVASFIMPDLLAAALILYALVLVNGWDDLNLSSKGVLAMIACFAILIHYGNIPLVSVCVAVALVVRYATFRRDFQSVGFALAPILVAVTLNAALSMIAFGQTSITPQRLPVMLARSIQDGPARWHLDEHCVTERYAICGIHATVPPDVGKILWSPQGIKHAPKQLQAAIRAEELLVLRRAFAEYPLQQLYSLSRNALLQLSRAGTADLQLYDPKALVENANPVPLNLDRGLLDTAGVVHQLMYAIGALAILVCLVGRNRMRSRPALGMVAVLVGGLLANAAIFGGLSAPVDRYQARIAWLVPGLAMLLWHRRLTSTAHHPADTFTAR